MAKASVAIRSKARLHTDAAIRVLAEVMNDPSAPSIARVKAATQLLNRGLGALAKDHQRFIPDNRNYYVYSVHDKSGHLIYVGKGCGRRSMQSAKRLGGKPKIRAIFSSEKQALAFEERLIKRFRPISNIVYNQVHMQ
jgi:hypothetical protein